MGCIFEILKAKVYYWLRATVEIIAKYYSLCTISRKTRFIRFQRNKERWRVCVVIVGKGGFRIFKNGATLFQCCGPVTPYAGWNPMKNCQAK